MCPKDTNCGPQAQDGVNVNVQPRLDLPLTRESWIDRAVSVDDEEAKVSDGL